MSPVVFELLGEILTRLQARIEIEDLHQVDDRFAPIELFFLLRGHFRDDLFDVDLGHPGAAACAARRPGRGALRRLAFPKMASLILPKMLICRLLTEIDRQKPKHTATVLAESEPKSTGKL